jgi:hypothetical protein
VFDFNHQLMKMINVSREDKALLRSTLSARLMPEDEREHIIKHMLLSSCSSFGPKAKNLLSWCPAPTQVKHIDSSTPVGHMSGCSILFSLKIFLKSGFLNKKLMFLVVNLREIVLDGVILVTWISHFLRLYELFSLLVVGWS